MTTKRQNTVQERAAAAWDFIEEVDNNASKTQKGKYNTLARKLPAMIQINGLGTTMAFLRSKSKPEKDKDKPDYSHNLIYTHISKWVTARMKYDGDLMGLVRNQSVSEYRQATTEAIEFGIWLKRYVEAKDWE